MKYLFSSLAFVSICALTGCTQSEPAKTKTSTADTKVDTSTNTASTSTATADTPPKTGKVYTVAVDADFPPFTYLDQNGKPTGYDVDLINAIAKNANMNIQLIRKNWSEFPQALDKGQVDLWIAGISVSEERKPIIDYSEPYLTYNTGVLTKKDKKGMAINQTNLAEQRLIALQGTVDFDYAKTLVNKPENLKGISTTFLGMKEVLTNKADAFINNDRVLQYHVKQYPNYNFRVFDLDTKKSSAGSLGIAVKKGNTELVQKLNQGLASIKQDGTYAKINQQWFGVADQN
ncbi:putative ABC transporter substrate binding protein [Moraxella macacae 0408225]|uniref:Putative ABC transporter substrate binding protein n=1 Tax=Moraxella macacae 0408225 TaxID=1230338 RepID=L2F8B0_9GAMM|nr:transporter substrate-binding domain-containing protein [Moraxella macacae]ELA09309.1 putative ABC transporter substrate binding protein [Moraxella macacae 0408225]